MTETVGGAWGWNVTESKLQYVETGDGPAYLANVAGILTVLIDEGMTVSRSGVGADIDKRDPDKAIKTAEAEALKKAGNKYGIALYLWDAEKRAEIEKYRQLSASSDASIKKAIMDKYGVKKAQELEVITGLSLDELQDRGTLLSLLAA